MDTRRLIVALGLLGVIILILYPPLSVMVWANDGKGGSIDLSPKWPMLRGMLDGTVEPQNQNLLHLRTFGERRLITTLRTTSVPATLTGAQEVVFAEVVDVPSLIVQVGIVTAIVVGLRFAIRSAPERHARPPDS